MGIKNINILLKQHAPDSFFSIPIDELSGKRIAIDGNNWMYTNMAIARKKVINKTNIPVQEPNMVEIRREWFILAVNFITGWLAHNITPVFVFDGKHPPEKDNTKAKRRDTRVAALVKIDALYAQLKQDSLENSVSIIEDLRKELRNYNFISNEDFELFKMVIKGIGIPCLQAASDGEQLCSSLCIEGKVAAVFSVDTDNLVYGCPLMVTGFSDTYKYDKYGSRTSQLTCVRLDRILEGMKISHSLFVDLCIMSGCDFNTNMPGYAAIKSFGLLRRFGSIDDLPRNLNTECLKHVRCREIFKYIPSDSLIINQESNDTGEESPPAYDFMRKQDINTCSPLDINKHAIATARDYLEMAGISGQIDRIMTSYHQITSVSDGYIEMLNLAPAPHYEPPPQRAFLNMNTRSPSVPFTGTETKLVTVPMPETRQPILTIPNIPHSYKFITLNIIPNISEYKSVVERTTAQC